MTENDLQRIVNDIKFPPYTFVIIYEGTRAYLQGQYVEADTKTGNDEMQKTRKWLLSPFMTKSEVVQTVFKCALTSMEHRTREHFTYQGYRVYSPHYDVDALIELCRMGRFDERDWYGEPPEASFLAPVPLKKGQTV